LCGRHQGLSPGSLAFGRIRFPQFDETTIFSNGALGRQSARALGPTVLAKTASTVVATRFLVLLSAVMCCLPYYVTRCNFSPHQYFSLSLRNRIRASKSNNKAYFCTGCGGIASLESQIKGSV
jgi:hypothetical protein